MPTNYLDIETEGFNADKGDKIITIQYKQVSESTGEPMGSLQILKAWESSEKEIIKQFASRTGFFGSYAWNFIPVGFNLNFDLGFLMQRCKEYQLDCPFLFSRPVIDLRAFGILMNRGQFKGSSLDSITRKPHDGKIIPVWYKEQKYEEILNYIRVECDSFFELLTYLYRTMPNVLESFRQATIIS